MTNEKNRAELLLPDRHPQPDFFVCDIFDAVPKSDTASMEFPLFTLSTKPDMSVREYKKGERWLKLSPSPIGLATVHDRDILIYCISQCMAAINSGREVQRKMRFQAYDLLVVTNRKTSGEGYKLFRAALKRLQGTQIETNISTGGEELWKVFSLIDDAEIISKTRDGRMQEIEITLSDWLFNAIRAKDGDILTLHKKYFRLRKPLERRLYELARKHCGTRNSIWKFTIEELQQRTGSQSTSREFKRLLQTIFAEQDHIPDYTFELINETVHIRPRPSLIEVYKKPEKPSGIDKIHLKLDTLEKAKRFAQGWDIHGIERDWREMLASKNSIPDKPDGSFINYVKWYVQENGAAQRSSSPSSGNLKLFD